LNPGKCEIMKMNGEKMMWGLLLMESRRNI
jgi:hypothetical protein